MCSRKMWTRRADDAGERRLDCLEADVEETTQRIAAIEAQRRLGRLLFACAGADEVEAGAVCIATPELAEGEVQRLRAERTDSIPPEVEHSIADRERRLTGPATRVAAFDPAALEQRSAEVAEPLKVQYESCTADMVMKWLPCLCKAPHNSGGAVHSQRTPQKSMYDTEIRLRIGAWPVAAQGVGAMSGILAIFGLRVCGTFVAFGDPRVAGFHTHCRTDTHLFKCPGFARALTRPVWIRLCTAAGLGWLVMCCSLSGCNRMAGRVTVM